MATVEQLATKYARRWRAAQDKRREVFAIANEISGLPLSIDDKHRIVELAYAQIVGPGRRPGAGDVDYFPTPKSGDNARYLDLVAALKGLIR